jgi:hypothetical protein
VITWFQAFAFKWVNVWAAYALEWLHWMKNDVVGLYKLNQVDPLTHNL